MGEVLFVLDGDDPGAAMLAAAFRRHGWHITLLDLRFSRPTLDATSDLPVVRLDGRHAAPDVVINRSATSGLGLAPPAALERQLPATWSGRHLAAREEQGLLLACLDLWDRQSRLYNPVRTLDRGSLRPAVAGELQAAGAELLPAALARKDRVAEQSGGRRGVCWIVDGAVVAALTQKADGRWAKTPVSDTTGAVVGKAAAVTALRLGQIDLWQSRDGTTFVTNWHALPKFRRLWERTGTDVAARVVATIIGESPADAPNFLCDDLEPNLLNPAPTRT